LHRGDVLRQLSDPEGLNVEVLVPPVIPPESEGFTPQDFTLDEAGQTLACPAGRQTTRRYRNRHDTGWTYQFSATDCGACPLRTQCFGPSSTRHGRRVNKGNYVAEYQAVRQKAQTPEYEEVRRMHRKVERKLAFTRIPWTRTFSAVSPCRWNADWQLHRRSCQSAPRRDEPGGGEEGQPCTRKFLNCHGSSRSRSGRSCPSKNSARCASGVQSYGAEMHRPRYGLAIGRT
jgi:hypothetical protein